MRPTDEPELNANLADRGSLEIGTDQVEGDELERCTLPAYHPGRLSRRAFRKRRCDELGHCTEVLRLPCLQVAARGLDNLVSCKVRVVGREGGWSPTLERPRCRGVVGELPKDTAPCRRRLGLDLLLFKAPRPVGDSEEPVPAVLLAEVASQV
jgi:hypothetical protein